MKFIQNTLRKWGRHDTALLAAAFSYQSLLAFPSLILFALHLAKLSLQSEDKRQQLLELIQESLPTQSADLVAQFGERSLEITSWGTGLITLGILLWSGSRMVRTLERVLNTIFEMELDPKKKSVWIWMRYKSLSLLLILVFAFLLIALITFTTVAGRWLDSPLLLYLLQPATSLVTLSLLFMFVLKWMLYAHLPWRYAGLSGLVLALGTGLGVNLISILFQQFNFASDFAVGASIVLFVIWINFMSSLIFLMLEVLHLWLKKKGQLTPKPYAHRKKDPHLTLELNQVSQWKGGLKTLLAEWKLFRWYQRRSKQKKEE